MKTRPPALQNLTSTSVTLQASKRSPEAKGQRRRPNPIARLLNWMYLDDDDYSYSDVDPAEGRPMRAMTIDVS